MQKYFVLLPLLLAPQLYASEWTGHLSLFLGEKLLQDSDWQHNEHFEYGLLVDFKQETWPLSIAIDYLHSSHAWLVDETTQEVDLGVRKVFDNEGSSVKPFVGGGLAIISASPSFGADIKDTLGAWTNAGLYWHFSDKDHVGVQLRYSFADEVTFQTVKLQPGGLHAGIHFGFRW